MELSIIYYIPYHAFLKEAWGIIGFSSREIT